jgi:hypothetical protein
MRRLRNGEKAALCIGFAATIWFAWHEGWFMPEVWNSKHIPLAPLTLLGGLSVMSFFRVRRGSWLFVSDHQARERYAFRIYRLDASRPH